MNIRFCTLILISLLFAGSSEAKTVRAKPDPDNLDHLVAAATEICQQPEQAGFTRQVNGRLSGTLDPLKLRKFFGVSIAASGDIKSLSWKGIQQRDIAQALESANTCRANVLRFLLEHRARVIPRSEAVTGPLGAIANTELQGIGDILSALSLADSFRTVMINDSEDQDQVLSPGQAAVFIADDDGLFDEGRKISRCHVNPDTTLYEIIVRTGDSEIRPGLEIQQNDGDHLFNSICSALKYSMNSKTQYNTLYDKLSGASGLQLLVISASRRNINYEKSLFDHYWSEISDTFAGVGHKVTDLKTIMSKLNELYEPDAAGNIKNYVKLDIPNLFFLTPWNTSEPPIKIRQNRVDINRFRIGWINYISNRTFIINDRHFLGSEIESGLPELTRYDVNKLDMINPDTTTEWLILNAQLYCYSVLYAVTQHYVREQDAKAYGTCLTVATFLNANAVE